MKEINIAYCILCHQRNKVLDALIDFLYKDNDIYIHIDRKSNIDKFVDLNKKATIINNRINVQWGGYSQINAIIKLLESTRVKKYDYIFIISGDDLPVKTNKEIKEYLIKNRGKEYIAYQESENIDSRLKYCYNKIWYKKNKNIIERILIKLQLKYNLIKENKFYDRLPKLYKGPTWFTITSQCRDYILEYIKDNQWYVDAFKKSLCGDEVFFHTIICNSKFKDNIYLEKDDDNLNCLRYIDWKSGPQFPKILNKEDYKNIKKHKEVIFARKFNNEVNIDEYYEYFSLNK